MSEEERESLNGQAPSEAEIKAPLVCDDFSGFAEDARAPYALIVNSILFDYKLESDLATRLREAITSNLNKSSHKTRNTIRSLLLKHFLGCEPQGDFPPLPEADHNRKINTSEEPEGKVFETAELLEQILRHLEPLDVVSTSGVNRFFQAVTKSSPLLQSKLFLRPIEPTATIEFSTDPNGRTPEGSKRRKYKTAECNPLLEVEMPTRSMLVNESWRLHMSNTLRFTNRIISAGCWIDMYLTNPPCSEIEVRLKYLSSQDMYCSPGARHFSVTADRRIREKNGITLAMLIQAAHSEGSVQVRSWQDQRNGTTRTSELDNTTVAAQIKNCDAQHECCCNIQLNFFRSWFQVVDVVLPYESDMKRWGTMTEEQRKRDSDVTVKIERGKGVSRSFNRL